MFPAPDGPADAFLVRNEPKRHLTRQLQLALLTICDAAEAKRPDLRVQTINRRPAEAPQSCGRGAHALLSASRRRPEGSRLLSCFIKRNIH